MVFFFQPPAAAEITRSFGKNQNGRDLYIVYWKISSMLTPK